MGLVILGCLLAVGAYKLLRAMYFLRKAKRLNARTAELQTEVDAIRARTAAGEAAAAAEVVGLGFVAAEDIDTTRYLPVPAGESAVLDAVRAGDWQAGADWIAAAGQVWEERHHRAGVLCEAAAEDDAWLLAWRAARPADPTAALVHAAAEVAVAWNLRGSLAGRHTTREQFALFHKALLGAREAAHEAQRLADPADPVPYVNELPVARGLGYPSEAFGQLWAEVVERGPKMQGAWSGALQYWCAKWHGSHERAEEFGREAAARGEPGDLLSLVLLRAHFEHENHEADLDPDVYYKRPEIVAAATAALADVAAAADPADRRVVRLRHMLAWVLYWQDRYEETVEQFRHIDGHCGIEPWIYQGRPKTVFLKTRDYSVRRVTRQD
ncbi:hypothetical protein [Streptomyces sp. NBC_00096]|uniref:hypothetical protein n=1 Tax=Streptomyces sp. NBC_00096 TaxID=2975650 RepID=UPI00324614E3